MDDGRRTRRGEVVRSAKGLAINVARAEAALRDPHADRAYYLIRHGTMRAGLYAPIGEDDQRPHDQDELYLIKRGHGEFFKEGKRSAVCEGDAIFVEAGAEHRFERFSSDFAVWVVFWGPLGGENAA